MLYVTETSNLPPRPANIPVEKLYLKESIGFVLWNGLRGKTSEAYLGHLIRADTPEGVIRFFGGTAVPLPYGEPIHPGVQSLIRMQEYFEAPLRIDMVKGFIPLHIVLAQQVDVHQVIGQASPTTQAPNVETHGLLPASMAFVQAFRHKLERVRLGDTGRVQTESGRAFNNVGTVHVLRHILEQIAGEGDTQLLTELNPDWDNGDYTPCHDTL